MAGAGGGCHLKTKKQETVLAAVIIIYRAVVTTLVKHITKIRRILEE